MQGGRTDGDYSERGWMFALPNLIGPIYANLTAAKLPWESNLASTSAFLGNYDW